MPKTGKPVNRGDQVRNPAKRKSISDESSRLIALREMFQQRFNPEYHQVMLRVSSAGQGLFFGSPPGKAR